MQAFTSYEIPYSSFNDEEEYHSTVSTPYEALHDFPADAQVVIQSELGEEETTFSNEVVSGLVHTDHQTKKKKKTRKLKWSRFLAFCGWCCNKKVMQFE